MLVTMSCFSEYLLLSTRKEKNYEAAIFSFILTTNEEYLSFDIMASLTVLQLQNFNKTLKWLSWKNWKGLTQWTLVPLCLTLKSTIIMKHQNVTKTLRWFTWKKMKGMNSMGLSDPLNRPKTINYYETPNCHQNLDIIVLDPFNQ